MHGVKYSVRKYISTFSELGAGHLESLAPKEISQKKSMHVLEMRNGPQRRKLSLSSTMLNMPLQARYSHRNAGAVYQSSPRPNFRRQKRQRGMFWFTISLQYSRCSCDGEEEPSIQLTHDLYVYAVESCSDERAEGLNFSFRIF